MKTALLIAALIVTVVGISIAGEARGEVQRTGLAGQGTDRRPVRVTAYISPASPQQLRGLARYRLSDGRPAITFAVLFAGNYAAAERPYLRANNNDPPTTKPLNDTLQQVLDDGSVKYLQARGIKVLLSITNGHSPVGWSEFTSVAAARDFVQYLKTDVVDKYGLDGIDIDDEYSSGVPNNASLIMVTTLMRRMMPNKIVSKAVFEDGRYFRARWRGHTLARNLDYGWQMTYGGPPQPRISPYAHWLNKNQLSLGFWTGSPSRAPANDARWLRDHGYAGVMLFGFEDHTNVDLAGDLVDAWLGRGNWNVERHGAGRPRSTSGLP